MIIIFSLIHDKTDYLSLTSTDVDIRNVPELSLIKVVLRFSALPQQYNGPLCVLTVTIRTPYRYFAVFSLFKQCGSVLNLSQSIC